MLSAKAFGTVFPCRGINKSVKLNGTRSSRNLHTEQYNQKLTFFLNGEKKILDAKDFEPDAHLITYLRGCGLTGTKLTCGEGGCGACTVTVSHYNKQENKVIHRAVNSCLVPLCYVDGTHVTTVEGVGKSTQLHPVQERLGLFGASQCGFCTPGFVMSMYTGLLNNKHKSSGEFCKAIDGNLCRCTGYRPIVDTLKSFCVDTKDSVSTPSGLKFSPYDPSINNLPFPEELKSLVPSPLHIKGERSQWFTPLTLEDLLQLKAKYNHAKIISGNTEIGIEQRFKGANWEVLISPVRVPELNTISVSASGLEIGSTVTLSALYELFQEKIKIFEGDNAQKHKIRLLRAFNDQLHWFAGTQIRNVASIGGNIVNASPISDLNPLYVAMNATFKLGSATGVTRDVPARDFFIGYKRVNMKHEDVLISISIPWNSPNQYVETYKQGRRREDDIAIVTAALSVTVEPDGTVEKSCLCYGGMNTTVVDSKKTQAFLQGKKWDQEETLNQATHLLAQEFKLASNTPGGMPEFRTTLALSFFYKFWLSASQQMGRSITPELLSATHKLFEPVASTGVQYYSVPKRGTSVGEPEVMLSAWKQVTGEAKYTDDIPPLPRELHAAFVASTKAHARILSINTEKAFKIPGVKAFFSHKDIPGNNLWGDIIADEELFASETVLHYGQPIGLIVAETEDAARAAARLVHVEYQDLAPIFTIEDAIKEKSFYPATHGATTGNVELAFQQSDHIIEGEINMAGQEQFYFEPNVTIAVPQDGDMMLYTSTQNANKTQKIVASVLGVAMHKVTCKVPRLGGGFGGKETRNINMTAAAALAAHKLQTPVRLLLNRDMDMQITGGRHPFKSTYKVGISSEGKFNAVDLQLYSNGGISHDLSVPVMIRALLFCDGCYNIPNFKNVGLICKTNMPSNTAFRGFGGPQGQLITEAWVEHAASVLNVLPEELREKNLYKEGDLTYYGSPVTKNVARSWEECKKSSNFSQRLQQIQQYNQENKWRKRGISMMPTKYGVAFNANFLNQGSALIHIYMDGSVLVSHGGVEMGQGLNTKVAQVVATALDIPLSKVHIQEMGTDKIPNASPTAASMGSDIYGEAALNACTQLMARLEPYKLKNPSASFKDWVHAAYFDRVNLSAQGFFKSGHKGYDFEKGGNPWRYFTIGTACTEVEIDCLTGDHKVLRADLVVDVGNSINPTIDIGQIEGAFMQGSGWVSIEELAWGDSEHSWVKPPGRLQTGGPGAYKIPSADDVPSDWRITMLKDVTMNPQYETVSVQSAKAVGEPPLLMGISVYTAIRAAIKAARAQQGLHVPFHLDSPLTAERIRMACVDNLTQLVIPDATKLQNFKAKLSC